MEQDVARMPAGGGPLRGRGFSRLSIIGLAVSVVAVADVDALAGPLLGSARPAVQPGRRIATVRREAGLSTALALMSRAQDSNPSAPGG